MVELNFKELDEKEKELFANLQPRKRGRKPKVEASPPTQLTPEKLEEYKNFAPLFCKPFNLVLLALHGKLMSQTEEVELTTAYMRVIEKWTPQLTNWKEEVAAGYMTTIIFLPPLFSYFQERKAKRKQKVDESRERENQQSTH